jgi:hypothetical protein
LLTFNNSIIKTKKLNFIAPPLNIKVKQFSKI